MFYIYKITNMINKKNYIGQTDNPERRWKQELEYLDAGIRFKNAIKKYGKENFKTEILFECNTREEANELEIKTIAKYRKNGKAEYNLSSGGGFFDWYKNASEEEKKIYIEKQRKASLGKVHSEETKRKIGIANKGKKRTKEMLQAQSERTAGEKHPFFGKKRPEHSELMKEIMKGKLAGEKHPFFGKKRPEHSELMKKESLFCTDEFKAGASERSRGEKNGMFGKKGKDSPASKRVICLTDNKKFDSLTEAANYYGITIQMVANVCNGYKKTTKGLIFKKIEDL